MSLINILTFSVEFILSIYFSYVVIYNLLLAIASRFHTSKRLPSSIKQNKIAVLIPSYKEDVVIISTAKSALLQNYPSSSYDVIVIADSLKDETVQTLKNIPVQVVPVVFDKSTKVKSLNSALAAIGDSYDIAVVLDADNVMPAEFLSLMNGYFNAGYFSIQGQRTAKNSNTKMAVLDGLSEAINNKIYLKGTCALGGATPIVGSGFAVKYDLFKNMISEMDSIGGFDKELDVKLFQKGIKTIYAEDACVYDEKVAKSDVFVNQRKRWIASQYFYLRKYFSFGIKALSKGDFYIFNGTVLRYIQLPRLLNLGLLLIIAILAFLLKPYLHFPFWTWSVLFGFFILSLMIAAPSRIYSLATLRAISSLPKTFLQMFLLMFKLKGGASKKFIHTPHGSEITR